VRLSSVALVSLALLLTLVSAVSGDDVREVLPIPMYLQGPDVDQDTNGVLDWHEPTGPEIRVRCQDDTEHAPRLGTRVGMWMTAPLQAPLYIEEGEVQMTLWVDGSARGVFFRVWSSVGRLTTETKDLKGMTTFTAKGRTDTGIIPEGGNISLRIYVYRETRFDPTFDVELVYGSVEHASMFHFSGNTVSIQDGGSDRKGSTQVIKTITVDAFGPEHLLDTTVMFYREDPDNITRDIPPDATIEERLKLMRPVNLNYTRIDRPLRNGMAINWTIPLDPLADVNYTAIFSIQGIHGEGNSTWAIFRPYRETGSSAVSPLAAHALVPVVVVPLVILVSVLFVWRRRSGRRDHWDDEEYWDGEEASW